MNYHDITKHDMLNGDGIRTTLFVSGCNHHCFNCQNPQTWDFDSGIFFDDNAMQEILDNLSADYCKGLTISGGDPLSLPNRNAVAHIISKVRNKYGDSKTIWVYTGYTYEELVSQNLNKEEWFNEINVLVDGRYIDDKRDVKFPFRGSTNQRLIKIKQVKTDA